MNNRREKKINTKRIEDILSIVESNGWHVSKKKFEGEFLGKKSVCHFKLEELPDFLFGIWLCPIEKSKVYGREFHIFGQYEKWSSKFKPSRNEVSADTTLESFLEGIKFVCENYDRYITDTYVWEDEYDEDGKLLCEQGWMIEDWTHDFAKKTFDSWEKDEEEKKIKNLEWFHKLYRLVSKDLFKEFSFINAVGMIDRGDCCSPRYNLGISINSCNVGDLRKVISYINCTLDGASCWDCDVDLCYFWGTKNRSLRKDIKEFKKHYDFDFLFTREKR